METKQAEKLACKKLWTIYLIVFQKSGCRPKVYIRSGTNTYSGVSKRFQQYDKS
jgi:hypothetical protein